MYVFLLRSSVELACIACFIIYLPNIYPKKFES